MTRHLKVCPTCTEELIDVVVAHAALTSAARVDRAVALPPRIPSDEHSGEGPTTSSGPGTSSLPPLIVPTELHEEQRTSRKPPRPHRLAVLVTVAAALVALGALGASVVAGHGSPGQPVVAQGSLQVIQAPPSATGTVTVLAEGTTRHMIVRTRDLSTPSNQEFYEVLAARSRHAEDAPGGRAAALGRRGLCSDGRDHGRILRGGREPPT